MLVVTLRYLTTIATEPGATPVTTPVADTVAIVVLADDQNGPAIPGVSFVTSLVEPSTNVAVTVNCFAAPTAGALPASASDFTVGDGVVWQPIARIPMTRRDAYEINRCVITKPPG